MDRPPWLDGCEPEGKPTELGRTFRAWQERIAVGRRDRVTRELEEFICRPENRERALDQLRVCLADPSSRVRLASIADLGRIGTLDDLGLLSDLLALPPQPDEDPREREAMIRAMQRISQACQLATRDEMPDDQR